jgi:UDP-N-acetylmuramate dehydrogenase
MIEVEKNKSLLKYNTFGIDVCCKYFVKIESIDDLKSIISDELYIKEPKLILGGGSNILLTKDFDGLVLLNELKGIEWIENTSDFALVKVASGEVWHSFVLWAIDNDLGGIENLSLIPGSVGAGPMQNIGAYGVELKEVFVELEALELETGKLQIFNREACNFGYRESVFKKEAKGKYFITSVTFKLTHHHQLKTSYGAIIEKLNSMKIDQPTIKDVSKAVIAIRQQKLPDPAILGNSGSFFKNPEVDFDSYEKIKLHSPNVVAYPTSSGKMKLAAGWLIEQCGWKGKVVGNVGSHKDQALVLVNYGNGTGQEIYELAQSIKASVFEKFGVEIEMEVNII